MAKNARRRRSYGENSGKSRTSARGGETALVDNRRRHGARSRGYHGGRHGIGIIGAIGSA